MEKQVFGYHIEPDIYIEIAKKRVINTNFDNHLYGGKQTILRDTMFRLLLCLLENANGSIIPNSTLLSGVWDMSGLMSSNQRLWQVMQSLKSKLHLIGISDDFIFRVESKGYYVKESMITVLYSEKKPVFRSTEDTL
jgi:DNA-binding winged helix-turn-helix (wHTH) protein